MVSMVLVMVRFATSTNEREHRTGYLEHYCSMLSRKIEDVKDMLEKDLGVRE